MLEKYMQFCLAKSGDVKKVLVKNMIHNQTLESERVVQFVLSILTMTSKQKPLQRKNCEKSGIHTWVRSNSCATLSQENQDNSFTLPFFYQKVKGCKSTIICHSCESEVQLHLERYSYQYFEIPQNYILSDKIHG